MTDPAASSSSSSLRNRTPRLSPDDCLEARPTQRVHQRIEADGDTWQETLAVCEAPSNTGDAKRNKKKNNNNNNKNDSSQIQGTLIIRSYFENTRNGRRVWDEPPSGASRILPATEEMRRMAELQLSELHIVTGSTQSSSSTEEDTKKKKRGFFGFGRKKKTNDASSSNPKSPSKIRYRPGSNMLAERSKNGQDGDAHLQEAIARSLAESQGIPYEGDAAGFQKFEYGSGGDDDELAIAKALSLSAAQETGETEEQLLARVMEESRIEDAIKRGAYQASASNGKCHTFDPAIEDERKMPAANLKTPPNYPITNYAAVHTPTHSQSQTPPRSKISHRFDPYAQEDAPSSAVVPDTKSSSRDESTVQKIDPKATSAAASHTRLFGKPRVTSDKVKEKAGLV